MSIKAVIVHSCFDGEVFGASSQPVAGKQSDVIFVEFAGPENCKCAKRIGFKMRDARLHCGEVYQVMRRNSIGHLVPVNEVVERRKQAKVPRGATIEKAHMQRATNYSNWTENEIIAEVKRLRSAIDIAHLRASEHDQNSPEYRFFLDEADTFKKTLGSIGAFRSERIRTETYNAVNQSAIARLGVETRKRGNLTPVIPHKLTMAGPQEPSTTYWMDCKTSAVGLKAEKVPYPDFAECSVCGFRLLDPQRLPKLVGQQKTHYYGLVSAIEREIGAAKQEGREPVFNGDVICFCPGCEKGRPFRIHKARQAN